MKPITKHDNFSGMRFLSGINGVITALIINKNMLINGMLYANKFIMQAPLLQP